MNDSRAWSDSFVRSRADFPENRSRAGTERMTTAIDPEARFTTPQQA